MRKLLPVFALLCGVCHAQIEFTESQYSEEARIAGLEGSVAVSGIAGSDGTVKDIRITQSLGLGLDEVAAKAVQGGPGDGTLGPVTVTVDFTLPRRQSHWHLAGVDFKAPEGVSRPTFERADYPTGPGISRAAYEEARILYVIGRAGEATVTFDIDRQGLPGNFKVDEASADVWGKEAAMLVRTWRFHPGMKAGLPVVVPCTVSLIWGPIDFQSGPISTQVSHVVMPPLPLPPINVEPLGQMLVSKVEPEYTPEARAAKLEGSVIMTVIVDQEGHPATTTVTYSPPDFKEELGVSLVANATAALSKWRFKPQLLNGVAESYSLRVMTNFELAGVSSGIIEFPKPSETR